ncbi:hypothetical protein HYT26_01520 [Candidatus Pacearchaeota archaeon]|nr:hypothetical protein [Candidatus Pacearchaeota archaeon]
MLKTIKKKNSAPYTCKICKLSYKDKRWADKCEAWCRNSKSCNLEITKHAIKSRNAMKI